MFKIKYLSWLSRFSIIVTILGHSCNIYDVEIVCFNCDFVFIIIIWENSVVRMLNDFLEDCVYDSVHGCHLLFYY